MKAITKRFLSVLLALTMLFSLSSFALAAEDTDPDNGTPTANASGKTIEASPFTMEVGESDTVETSLSGSRFQWESSNPDVLSVSGRGGSANVSALKEGRAKITATVTEGAGEDAAAGSETWSVTVNPAPKPAREDLGVKISPEDGLSLVMDEGSGTLTASTEYAVGSVSYSWASYDTTVAVVSGNGSTATVRPVGVGSATITVTATDSDQSATEYITVTVSKPQVTRVMVSALDSTTVKLDAGETVDLSALVSGGSGDYAYVWNESGVLELTDQLRANATVRGTNAGTGTVTLYVYDAQDNSNYGTVTWNITVNSKTAPMNITLDPATVSLNVGESRTLNAEAVGGSGDKSNYSYQWGTNNGNVSVSGSGSAATVSAGSAGTALITVTVTDRVTGSSSEANCTVVVENHYERYEADGSATVGTNSDISASARSIASGYQDKFKVALTSSASVRLTTPSASIAQLYLSNGGPVKADASYTYDQFSSMYLRASAPGSFSTAYTVNDGGNVLSGTLTLTASGGIPVESVTINKKNLTLDLNSSYFLNVGVMPSNAAYTVTWTTSNSNIAYIEGTGSSVTVRTRSRTGTATITASVQGPTGQPIERTCAISVEDDSSETYAFPFDYNYNPSLTLTVGSDYYGTNLADAMRDRFRAAFGVSLHDSATIRFADMGSTRVAVTRLSNGTAIRANTDYTFAEYTAMSVVPVSAGTITGDYVLKYNGRSLGGRITIYVRAGNVNATISPANITLAPNSSQLINVSVTPANSYYTVSWSSSNTSVAAVSGNGTTATVNCKSKTGTATITATVRDRSGVRIDRSCVVTVKNQADNIYNPSLAMTLGVNYTGTTLSSALASQFRAVHGISLDNNAARIRFASVGNSSVAVTYLPNGMLMSDNKDYTFAEYINMYAQPISAGSFNVPYTLTYAGRSLTGTIMVSVSASSINASLRLNSLNPYVFGNPAADGALGSAELSSAITNAVGYSWSYIRFDETSKMGGTLYQDSFRTSLGGSNITSSALASLCYVPAQIGTSSYGFTVYNANGGSLAKGTLMVSVTNGSSQEAQFNDVMENDWFRTPVSWAVNRNITNGTGIGIFSPNTTCTTSQILTFLWRSKGSPMPTIGNPFSDVNANDFYYNAALWAYQNGLVSGSRFNGDHACTRVATVTYLWRLAGSPEAISAGFTDVTANTEVAAAVNWAVAKGITNGTSASTFEPMTTCNRAQIVTFLYRAYA